MYVREVALVGALSLYLVVFAPYTLMKASASSNERKERPKVGTPISSQTDFFMMEEAASERVVSAVRT